MAQEVIICGEFNYINGVAEFVYGVEYYLKKAM